MKIGVLGCFFDCADLLPEVLRPWTSLKAQGFPFIIGAIHTQFYEYKDLGYPPSDDATKEILKKEKALDVLRFSAAPLFEKDARQLLLSELLQRGVDMVWLLDGDEMYSEQHIKGILEYVEKTPQFDYYHVHLDNRVFGEMKWTDGFFPPRIIRTDRHGGIRVFTWDNELKFNDGTTLYGCVPGIIPKRIAHVPHYTWRKEDAEKKIAYQHAHFGFCPFKLEEGSLVFDESYFTRHGMPLPKVSADGSFAIAEKPDVRVVYTDAAANSAKENEQALVHLICSLLVHERKNMSHITLTLHAAHATEAQKALLDLCPFDTEVSTARPSTDSIRITAEDCAAGPAFILSMIESQLVKDARSAVTV